MYYFSLININIFYFPLSSNKLLSSNIVPVSLSVCVTSSDSISTLFVFMPLPCLTDLAKDSIAIGPPLKLCLSGDVLLSRLIPGLSGFPNGFLPRLLSSVPMVPGSLGLPPLYSCSKPLF